MFKDKLFLVMLVLGLLTIVAAAGVVTIQRGNSQEEVPYMQMEEPGAMIAEESQPDIQIQVAGNSNASQAQQETTSDTQYASQYVSNPEAAHQQAEVQAEPVGAGQTAATPLVLNFTDTS